MLAASDNEKILYVVNDILGATSPKTSVDMRTIVDTGINLGLTCDYPRGREDGHPWWPHTATMMGVGSQTAVENNEEPYLHREKMKKGNSRVRMYYWYDRSHTHELVTKDSKARKYGKASTPSIPKVRPTMDTALADKVTSYLHSKGYHQFLFGLQGGNHILTLHVVDAFFFTIPISSQSADRTLRLIPYFYLRPDQLTTEVPGAKITKNWKLWDNWNKVTSK